jgi:replicative DNA helicase
MFSIEMKRDAVLRRIWAHESGISFSKIRNPKRLNDTELARLQQARNEVANWPLFINDMGSVTPEQFLAQARLMVLREHIELVIVDYIQIMQAKGRDDTERMQHIADTLRLFAKDYCPVLALSQLSRPDKKNVNTPPVMTDLKGSSALEQHAQVILMLHRPKKDGKETGKDVLIVEKNREGETGVVPVSLHGQFLRYVARET